MIYRINLIGCSKSKHYKYDRKRGGRVTPSELYTGALFRKRVEYSERLGVSWMVLSAKFGLWRPDVELRPIDEMGSSDEKFTPYSLTMADLSKADRAIWHSQVAYTLLHELWEPIELDLADEPLDPRDLHIEIHAGKDYSETLAKVLTNLGVSVSLPVQGLSIGQQLQWYDQQAREAPQAA